MATIPYLYSKGEGQGFRVRAANKNAGINVDRFFRANQKQEAINFAKQIEKKIKKETEGFINREQLGKKLGVSFGTIEKYKMKDNEIYKKIKELFEIKKTGQTSPELYKPKTNTAIEEVKKLVDIGNVKPKLTYRGEQTSMSLIKNALNESETPLNIKQLKEKFPKIPSATIQTSLAELKFNKNFKDKISLISPKEVADVGAQTKAIKRTPMMNVLRNVFVLDPDADSTDIAKAIYGDKNFNNADNIKKLEYLKDAARQVPKFVAQFSKGASTVTPGFKSIRSDKLGDILDSIENRISDFGFEPGIRRDLQLSIADAKRGLPEGATRMARNRLLQRGMAVDEVGAVAATFDRAPGYLEATQVIDFLKNKDKGKKLDLKFSRALGKALDGDFSDIKDYNQLAKDFGKKYKIDVPIFLTGKNLKPEEQIKYFDEFSEGAQKNIKEIAKQNNFIIKTKSKPLFSLAGIPFQGKGKYAFLGLAAPFIVNATPYQGGNQPSPIQDTQTAMQDQVVEGQAPQPKLAEEIKYDSYAGFVKPEDPNVRASQSDVLYWIADNEIPEEVTEIGKMVGQVGATIGGATVALGLPDVKKTIEERKAIGKSPITGTLAKGFYRLGSPLATAAFTAPQILDEETTTKDIVTDPLNYLGLATMETLGTKAGTIAAPAAARAPGILGFAKDFGSLKNVGEAIPGKLSTALRLGLSPRVIAGASRFLGIPGLVASGAYSLYDYLSNKNKESE
jgi:hypothetical protein